MSKTLIVSYLPAGTQSITKKLLDAFIKEAEGKTELVHRNLLADHPPIHDEKSMSAYKLRGFMGKELDGDLKKALEPFDALIDELLAADKLVLAFPMHNFALPGVVKTYIDAVSQYGRTILVGEKGPYGALGKVSAAVLYASGGQYDEGSPRNTVPMVLDIDLNQIGISDIAYVNSGGTLMGDEALNRNLDAALDRVRGVAKTWYK